MYGRIFRIIWRVLIFLAGAALGWFAIFTIYPYADSRLPAFVVLLLLYCLFAYIVIPALVRLFRLVIKPDHLPVYATSRDGWSSDPVNIVILCKSRTQLRRTMHRAGWHQADVATLATSLHLAYATIFRRPYLTAPFSSLYLFGRRQDIGFQMQTGDQPSPRHRHHIRFWRLSAAKDDQPVHATFWQTALRIFTRKNRQIWVGAATHDVAPFALRIQNLQLTHKIDADTNRERDFVIKTLKENGLVRRVEIIQTGQPLSFRGQTFGVRIVVDGLVKVVDLKRF
jgi:hypothetical protein